MASLVTPQPITLKNHPEINEKSIQQLIEKDPSILGLGDLAVLNSEKILPNGGRLDILLADDSDCRYELELQLGATDESHIIRTIEYWDLERKRYPQFDHCAVIVAEDITSRFFNIISLFNGQIPLIALKLTAYKQANGDTLVTFTKVLDRLTYSKEIEENYEPTDRDYWLKRSTKSMMELSDQLFADIFNNDASYSMKYNKYYVGITINGIANNFVYVKPQKKCVQLFVCCDMNEEIFLALEERNVDIEYNSRSRRFKIKINKIKEFTDNKDLIDTLIESARKRSGIC